MNKNIKLILAKLPLTVELIELIKATVSEVGAASIQDKGKLMGKLMPQVRGKADGTVVNQMATEYLESLS